MQAEELSYVIVTPYSMRKSRTGGIISRLISRTGSNKSWRFGCGWRAAGASVLSQLTRAAGGKARAGCASWRIECWNAS